MLTLRLVCVGRMKAGAEQDLCRRYIERAAAAGRSLGFAVELRELSESKARQASERKTAEAATLRSALGDKPHLLVVFDERGRSIESGAFAALFRRALEQGIGVAGLVIGGPDGLEAEFRESASEVIALGSMTWPHQLARIMVAEQIYRAITILGGHPYHRA